ncbi:preprotein translocase subunit SecE [Patescibacteria group bacterium]
MSQNPENKGNVLVEYLKGAYQEVKKVTWPTRKETWKKSWIVIWFSIGFAVFLGSLDYIMNKVLEVIL